MQRNDSIHSGRNKISKLFRFLFVLLFVEATSVFAESAWTHLTAVPAARGLNREVQPDRGELFQLDASLLRTNFAKARLGDPVAASQIGLEVDLPMPDGTFSKFKIVEAPVMAPELAAKFPEIKTYAGVGLDDPDATIRLDLTPLGFHAQVLSPHGSVYVDPAYKGDSSIHVSYYKRDYRKMSDEFQCLIAGRGTGTNSVSESTATTAARTLSGATLRTYRLAVATTGEYTAYFGGTVQNGLAAVVTAVNRVDGVYETELAVRLVLVANNDLLIYTSSGSDPYTNGDPSSLLSQNQSTIDSVIGSGNYDIGHVFSTAGGGLAALGVVCVSGYKAQGETGMSSPVGDAFYVDYVAHEMGHQFGANHTFNSVTGSCSGNREAGVAYEPGSGSTIMAYAGICSPNDLQPHSDPYFHAGSLNEIQTYLSGTSCAVTTSATNSAPTVSAGPAYTIPASTPFALTAVASDPDGNTLTYCWEEMDLGPATALIDPDNGSSPLFRSLSPTTNAIRYFPKLSSILANTNWNQEIRPTTSRTMNFRVTVRDNHAGGGGVADADTTVTVVSGAGPFAVTSPNSAVSWSGARTVTWNVAGTTNAPISCGGVNIYLSINGGTSFPYLLGTNVPNTGTAAVVLPNITTTQARIKVQGAGNIFYDVSDASFTITPGTAQPLVQFFGTSLVSESCSPANGVIDPYETVTLNLSLVNVGSGPTTNVIATLLATNGIYYPSGSQTYGAIAAGAVVSKSFSFVSSGVCGGSVTSVVQVVDGAANLGSLMQSFVLGQQQVLVSTQVFANANFITINDAAPATPYPSTIVVSGVTNTISKVRVILNGFSHTYPEDVGVLVVAPNGQNVVLMDGAGNGGDVSGIDLTFDDGGALLSSAQLNTAVYKPTDLFGYPFNSPAPGSHGSALSALTSTPNGTWSLYVQDFQGGDDGNISGGWSLQLLSSITNQVCCTTFPTPSFTSTTYSNNTVRFAWSAIPGPNYQVQYRTNLTVGSWQNLGSLIPGTNTLLNITDYVTNGPVRFYRVVVSQ